MREGSERRERRASEVDRLGRLRQAASLCLPRPEHEEPVLNQEGEQQGRQLTPAREPWGSPDILMMKGDERMMGI